MKKSGTIVAFLLLSSLFANAQYKNHAVKLNVFGLFGGQYVVSYEGAIGKQFSAQLSGGGLTGSLSGSTDGEKSWDAKRTGFIVVPEIRYYFEEGLKGAYCSAFFRYRTASWDVRDLGNDGANWSYEQTRTAIGGGILAGYQFYISKELNMDLFLGPQIKSVETTMKFRDPSAEGEQANVGLTGLDRSGVGVRLGLTIGYAF